MRSQQLRRMVVRMYLYSAKGRKAFVWNVFSGTLDFALLATIRTGWFLLEAAPFSSSGKTRGSAIVIGTSTTPALPAIGSIATCCRYLQGRGDPRDKCIMEKESHRWIGEHYRRGIRTGSPGPAVDQGIGPLTVER